MIGVMTPALVLLHGFTQTRQSWRRTAQALEGRYRALVPDLPGHGQAVHRTASFDACAAYVRALAPARTFALCGLLDGRPDRAARRAHARARDRHPARARRREPGPGRSRPRGRSAAPPTTRSPTGSRRSTSRPSRASGARSRCSRTSRSGSPRPPTRIGCATRLHGLAAALRGLGTGVMEPLWDRLPELAIPVTLIAGERDAKFRGIAEAMRERLPNAQLVVVEGAGHAVQLERRTRWPEPSTSLSLPRPPRRSRRPRSPLRGASRTRRCRA